MLPQVDVEGSGKAAGRAVCSFSAWVGWVRQQPSIWPRRVWENSCLSILTTVELSNLQRQIVHHGTAAIGQSKVDSAIQTLSALNPETRLTARVVADLEADADLIDADRRRGRGARRQRQLRNALCAQRRLFCRWVGHWSPGPAFASKARSRCSTRVMTSSPCYRCLYPEGSDEALNCAENGVAAPLVGIIGTVQAMEAMKLITGVGDPLVGHVLVSWTRW